MAICWGVVGAGKITHDFVTALRTLSPENHCVEAIASKDLTRATKFASEHQIPTAYACYTDMAQDEKITVVYIGNQNNEHFDVAKLMLESGKNVLCEKPFCLNEAQTVQLMDLAEQKKCFLMEAIWSRCFPVYAEIRKILQNKEIGDVRIVSASLGFPLQYVERICNRNLGGGSLLDLGVYVLQLTQMIFGSKPRDIEATAKLNSDGVDLVLDMTLTYENGKIAFLSVDATKLLTNSAKIVGSTGTIEIPNFWCPTSFIDASGKTQDYPLPETDTKMNFFNSTGLSYEAEEVRQCISKGLLESPLMPKHDIQTLAKWRDVIRKQIGVIFDVDTE